MTTWLPGHFLGLRTWALQQPRSVRTSCQKFAPAVQFWLPRHCPGWDLEHVNDSNLFKHPSRNLLSSDNFENRNTFPAWDPGHFRNPDLLFTHPLENAVLMENFDFLYTLLPWDIHVPGTFITPICSDIHSQMRSRETQKMTASTLSWPEILSTSITPLCSHILSEIRSRETQKMNASTLSWLDFLGFSIILICSHVLSGIRSWSTFSTVSTLSWIEILGIFISTLSIICVSTRSTNWSLVRCKSLDFEIYLGRTSVIWSTLLDHVLEQNFEDKLLHMLQSWKIRDLLRSPSLDYV